MRKQDNKSVSKFLSLVLRHKPEEIGLHLDSEGWTDVKDLLQKAKINLDKLESVVRENDKQRFAFNTDRTKIRASQGHSINVDLQLDAVKPPDTLYHGTVNRYIDSIFNNGIVKMSRTHVHLSADMHTAVNVGSRRGKAILLAIDSGRMYTDGIKFYQSANGVWLTDYVADKYFSIIN